MFANHNLGRVKSGIHAVQAVFIFVAWVLTIAILTKSGYLGGQIYFIFALCFISVPALIYQVAVPTFPRAQRLANVYAYAIIDTLFTILWFSAAIAVVAWTTQGINKGKETEKDSDGTCKYFAFGDSTKCNVSRADTAFAWLICFLFAATSAISILFVRRYRATGEMPGRQTKPAYMPAGDAMGKGAWSASVEERDHDSIDEPDERRKYGQILGDDEHGLLNNSAAPGFQHASDPHPGSHVRFGGSTQHAGTNQQYDGHVPSALSPDGYGHHVSTSYRPHDQPSQQSGFHSDRLEFPVGNYDRV